MILMESYILLKICKLPLLIRSYLLQSTKRDTFDFSFVNFPNLSGNIPCSSSYGVCTGEAVRYARACSHLEDFESRTLTLVSKLRKQGFTLRRLTRTWFRVCDAHLLLVQKYGSRVFFLYKDFSTVSGCNQV